MSRSDIFADIRHHAGAQNTTKFLHENVVLAAVEEILDSQKLTRTPVAYLGALMMSLQAEDSRTEPAVYAGMLTLLERTLSPEHVSVPRAVVGPWSTRFSHLATANTQK